MSYCMLVDTVYISTLHLWYSLEYLCRGVAIGNLSRKMKYEFGIACYYGHSAGHLKKIGL